MFDHLHGQAIGCLDQFGLQTVSARRSPMVPDDVTGVCSSADGFFFSVRKRVTSSINVRLVVKVTAKSEERTFSANCGS